MAIFRIEKTKNYTVLSNYHFKEKDLSLKAKGLLSLMLSLPDSWNYTIKGLVTLSKDGKDSVMSALAELEEFRYLERKRTTDKKGRFTGIEYHIYEQPIPYSGNQNSDNQNSDNQDADNPPQLNTKQLKTEFKKVLKDKDTKNINDYLDILDTIPDDRLRNIYVSFIENRRLSHAPISRDGLVLLMDRVREIAGLDIERQIDLLRTAVINNWKNVYAKNEEPKDHEIFNKLKSFYE